MENNHDTEGTIPTDTPSHTDHMRRLMEEDARLRAERAESEPEFSPVNKFTRRDIGRIINEDAEIRHPDVATIHPVTVESSTSSLPEVALPDVVLTSKASEAPEGWLTAGEVSERLGVSRAWVSRLCQSGDLEHKRVAGRGRAGYSLRINPESLDSYASRPRATAETPEGYCTIDDIATTFGVSRAGAHYMLKVGKVRADRFGRRWYVKVDSVSQYVAELARRKENARHYNEQNS